VIQRKSKHSIYVNGEFLIWNCTDEKLLVFVVIPAEAGIQGASGARQDDDYPKFSKKRALQFLCQEIRQDEACK